MAAQILQFPIAHSSGIARLVAHARHVVSDEDADSFAEMLRESPWNSPSGEQVARDLADRLDRDTYVDVALLVRMLGAMRPVKLDGNP